MSLRSSVHARRGYAADLGSLLRFSRRSRRVGHPGDPAQLFRDFAYLAPAPRARKEAAIASFLAWGVLACSAASVRGKPTRLAPEQDLSDHSQQGVQLVPFDLVGHQGRNDVVDVRLAADVTARVSLPS
jgi:hypothetical protein